VVPPPQQGLSRLKDTKAARSDDLDTIGVHHGRTPRGMAIAKVTR
jgi:hypothetical protein